MSASRLGLCALILASVFVSFVGCSEPIEKNPIVKKQRDDLEKLNEFAKAIGLQAEDAGREIAWLKATVDELNKRPNASTSNARVAGLEREVTDLKAELDKAMGQLRRVEALVNSHAEQFTKVSLAGANIEDRVRQMNELAERMRKENAELAAKVGSGSSGGSRTPVATAAGDSTQTAGGGASIQLTRGGYYMIQEGQTLEDIARAHRIGLDDLRGANRLPPGAQLFAGQRIYIPPSR